MTETKGFCRVVTASKPRFPEAEKFPSNTEHLPGAARAARRATRQTGLLLPLWQQPPLLRGGLSRSRAGAEPPGCREPPAVAGENTRFIHTREWHFAAQNINSERLFPMRRSLTAAGRLRLSPAVSAGNSNNQEEFCNLQSCL